MPSTAGLGTLGTKFARDPTTCETVSCKCNDGISRCGNYHDHRGTVTLWGQCCNSKCTKNLGTSFVCRTATKSPARKKIDLTNLPSLRSNMIKQKMTCGHVACGIEEIDVCFKKNQKGFFVFTINSKCFSCNQTAGLVCLVNKTNKKIGKTLPSTPCCDTPQVFLQKVSAQFAEPGGIVKVPAAHLRYSQDSCKNTFSHGEARGKSIEMTVEELEANVVHIDDIDQLIGGVKGVNLFVDGNRRLNAYKKSGQERVPVKMQLGGVKFSHPFTTLNEGTSIRVRGRRSTRNGARNTPGRTAGYTMGGASIYDRYLRGIYQNAV